MYCVNLPFKGFAQARWVTYFITPKKDVSLFVYSVLEVPGRVGQLVMCLTADVCLTAEPGVARSILAHSHTSWRLIMK